MGDYIDQHSPNSLAWVLGLVMIGILICQSLFFYKQNSKNILEK